MGETYKLNSIKASKANNLSIEAKKHELKSPNDYYNVFKQFANHSSKL